jgi:glyoxylate/hydroxypyruvate reductase A
MALLLTPLGPPPEWLRHFKAELPDLEVRLWPEFGNRDEIEIAAVGSLPHGELARLPKLRMIASLFAGQDLLLGDPQLPDVPIVRTDTPDGSWSMTETVLLHVLRHHRFLPQYQEAQQRREWKPLPRLRPSETKVGIMGLGPLGLAAAKTLRDYGFDVAGWVRRRREEAGIAVFHGNDQLGAFLARSMIVVNLLPPTPALRDVLNRETFALLPKGASIINLGRGMHILDEDLIARQRAFGRRDARRLPPGAAAAGQPTLGASADHRDAACRAPARGRRDRAAHRRERAPAARGPATRQSRRPGTRVLMMARL